MNQFEALYTKSQNYNPNYIMNLNSIFSFCDFLVWVTNAQCFEMTQGMITKLKLTNTHA